MGAGGPDPNADAAGIGRRVLAVGVLLLAVWLAWPLLRPALWPAAGGPLVVVLDGYFRLPTAFALQRQRQAPLLLVACPQQFPYSTDPTLLARAPGPVRLLGEGFDTATQMTALAGWLEAPPQPVAEVLLVSDRSHLRRAALAARLAVGSLGVRVTPVAAEPDRDPQSHEGLALVVRDAVRISAWRATGSTLAFLQPFQLAWKRQGCLPP